MFEQKVMSLCLHHDGLPDDLLRVLEMSRVAHEETGRVPAACLAGAGGRRHFGPP